MAKLLASDVIEIDEKFLDKVKSHLEKKEQAENEVERLFTVHQVASYTQTSAYTVRRHIKDGLLKAVKVGKNWLVSEQDYKNYTNKNDE